MEETDSQDARDADWETSQEITIVQEGEPRSSVAQRTRSKTDHIRKANMSELMGTKNKTMEGSFEIIDEKADDPLYPIKDELTLKEEVDEDEWKG